MERVRTECAAVPVQLLVHTAGLARFHPYFETDVAEFDRQYGVNVKPNIYLTQVVTIAPLSHRVIAIYLTQIRVNRRVATVLSTA